MSNLYLSSTNERSLRKPHWQLGITLTAFCSVVTLIACSMRHSSSTEMKRLFDEDQRVRQIEISRMTSEQRGEWASKINASDEQRRKRVLELLQQNELRTGEDFEEAAFIMQHGAQPDDFLLGHALAMVAIAKGSTKSRWIAAATLDRYLQTIGQPQVFGTQYAVGANANDKWNQDPYNRPLVPDALRSAMCVPAFNQQIAALESLNRGKDPEDKQLEGCH